MKKEATVYIVTSGDYSSYRINAVYLDKAHAELHARLEDCEVEEWGVSGEAPAMVEELSCVLRTVGGTVEPIVVTNARTSVRNLTEAYQKMKAEGLVFGEDRARLANALRSERQKLRELINTPDLPKGAPMLARQETIRWVEQEEAESLVVWTDIELERSYSPPVVVRGTDFERVRKTFSTECARFFHRWPEAREHE